MIRLSILASPIFLSACGWWSQVEYVPSRPAIPPETLIPCPISERRAETLRQLAVLAGEHLEAARCANGKIETIARILAEE